MVCHKSSQKKRNNSNYISSPGLDELTGRYKKNLLTLLFCGYVCMCASFVHSESQVWFQEERETQ